MKQIKGENEQDIKENNNANNESIISESNFKSELDFDAILNAVGQGVLVTGEGWRFEYVNPALAKIF
ncbi:MAG: PAS domain-containing protein, partial [Methanothrix sp.]|nr:PAS domain-containing protein [Methanothrix sp.]